MKYYVEGITHVVEVNPMDLRISVQNIPANFILHKGQMAV